MYRLLISGSRKWEQEEILRMAILRVWVDHPDLVVIHGDCPAGADNMARRFCEKYQIPEERYPADWNKYGKPAGHIRNKQMVDTKPDRAIFFIAGDSKGTRNCMNHAIKAGIPYDVYGRER